MHTTWTHCNEDIKILTKWSLDKADVDVISTHCQFDLVRLSLFMLPARKDTFSHVEKKESFCQKYLFKDGKILFLCLEKDAATVERF